MQASVSPSITADTQLLCNLPQGAVVEISEVPGHVGAPPWSAHRGVGSRGRGDGGNTVGGGTGATIVARRCVMVGRERRCSSRRGLGKRLVREAAFAQVGE